MDLLRPRYHFVPEKNWMNDPNGVCYYKGEYHLFYQYNPNGPQWGDIHWGHAKSPDLVHWEEQPIALKPDRDQGELHCFSGCAVVTEEAPLLFYTSVGEGERSARDGAQLWAAAGDLTMEHFTKLPGNPLLARECHGAMEVKEWRDPYVLKKDGRFYLVQGASVDEKGCALIYESEDLLHWRYLNILHETDSGERIWECPNLLDFGEKLALVISPDGAVKFFLGTMGKENQFVEEARGFIDYGGFEGFYAPNTLMDDMGRHIMIGWMPDRSRGEHLQNIEWSGVQSIPRTMEYADGKLIMRPAEEMKRLRKAGEHLETATLRQGNELECRTHSRTFELLLTLEGAGEDSQCSLEFLKSAADGKEEKTVIAYDGKKDSVTVDRSLSSLSGQCSQKELTCTGTHRKDGLVTLHLFVDCSTVELFINDREAISARVYPEREASDAIVIKGRDVAVRSLDIWELSL